MYSRERGSDKCCGRVVSVRERYLCALILCYTALGFAARFNCTGKCEDLNAWERAEYEIPRLFCVRSEIGISSDVAFLLREMAHIGNEIREVLKQQGRTVTWFAEQLNCNRTNIYNIFKKEDLDTQLLKRICLILDYNFFQEVCTEINTQVSKNS